MDSDDNREILKIITERMNRVENECHGIRVEMIARITKDDSWGNEETRDGMIYVE